MSTVDKSNVTYTGAESALPGFYLFSEYPASTIALSVARLLNPDYKGPAIRVRRSSDNAEQNIAFVNGVLDEAALLAFSAGGDAYVTTLYGQVGGLNAQRSVAAAQPRIVSAGVIDKVNGRPSMYFNGTSHYLVLSGASLNALRNVSQAAIFTVAQLDSLDVTRIAIAFSGGTSPARQGIIANSPTLNRLSTASRRVDGEASSQLVSAADVGANVHVVAQVMNYAANTQALYTDDALSASGVASTSGPGATSDTASLTAYVGVGVNTPMSGWWQGHISEVLVYGTDQSANRSDINQHAMSFYGVAA
ncbi:arabinofuranosidase catalytic domain-containing protein [Hydrocarboniphaga effusa]|uniref:arabinofuranosidase catalytic domain-containing protein n=1 Tax=Hydrocarboniphaga effusa TaxID=243629 RepID=UPI003BA8506E